jgi:hypothetical protein
VNLWIRESQTGFFMRTIFLASPAIEQYCLSMLQRRGFKAIAMIPAILIGVGIIALAGSLILPSTKRARIDLEELRQMNDAAERTASQPPATNPTTLPATEPTQQR